VAFFGISFFDQNIVTWYCLLAMISAVAAGRSKKGSKPQLADASSEVDLVPAISGAPAGIDAEPPVYAWKHV
jgi:hypothetical protein